MATYDSDSSEGEYTETNVLLGYASKDGGEETISRLGGNPDWMDLEKPLSAALARCKVCKDLMAVLLQLNAELPDKFPGHDRRIYVFACWKPSCQRKPGSICAVRGVRVWKEVEGAGEVKEEKKGKVEEKNEVENDEKKGGKQALGETLFGATAFGSGASSSPFATSANPFSSSSSAAPSNPFASPAPSNPFGASAKPASPEPTPSNLSKTFAETLSLNAPPKSPPPPAEPWPTDSASLPKPYPTLYLDEAEYETLDPVPTAAVPATATMEGADAPEPSILDREAFESAMDGTFQKFADRMSQNPEQVIRYEFGGQPLLYAKNDAVGQMLLGARGAPGGSGSMPRCGNCGGKRVFEVQLTPRAITELEADELSLEGMEWGTILVGVCEADCVPNATEVGEAGYLAEWAGVQWEELSKGK